MHTQAQLCQLVHVLIYAIKHFDVVQIWHRKVALKTDRVDAAVTVNKILYELVCFIEFAVGRLDQKIVVNQL